MNYTVEPRFSSIHKITGAIVYHSVVLFFKRQKYDKRSTILQSRCFILLKTFTKKNQNEKTSTKTKSKQKTDSVSSRVGRHYRPHLAPEWGSVIFRGLVERKKKLASEIT